MTDQELKDLVASLAVSQAKTDEQLKKTDEQLKKTDEQLKQTDKELRELFKQTDEQLKKTDEQLKRTDKQIKRTDARLDKVAKQLGGISNNQGDVAEEYFINSLKATLKLGNLDFDYLVPNFRPSLKKNYLDEFDILLVNGKSVAIVEVKYKVHPDDLKKLPKKIKNLKKLSQYADYKIYAGIAGFYVPKRVIKEAKEEGFFVLQRKGDIVQTFADNLKAA